MDHPSTDVIRFFGIVGAIIIATMFLIIAFYTTRTSHIIHHKSDSISQKLISLQLEKDSIGVSGNPLGNVSPPTTDNPSGNTTNSGSELPGWVGTAVAAFGLLVCIAAYNSSWYCILVAVILLIIAVVLWLIHTKVIPYLKKKCKKKKKHGFFGWLLKLLCFLLIVLDWIVTILAIVCFLVGLGLLIFCGWQLIRAIECIFSLAGAVKGATTLP